MSKKILAIGGSYFIGRVFSILTARDESFELTVVNRGSQPLRLDNVEELICDRHDTATLQTLLAGKAFDAAIDFCAYAPGDAQAMMEALNGIANHYLYISTCSVLGEGSPETLDETAPIKLPEGDDPVSDYVRGKALLEAEVKDVSAELGLPYTIVRPAFTYGPFNYAPRESWFIKKIVHGEPIPFVTDAPAQFSFSYVFDIAYALHAVSADERAYGQIFNVTGPEKITNEEFVKVLKRDMGPFETYPVTVNQVESERIPLPFPLIGDALYDGTKISRLFDFTYTSFVDGMKKTCEVFTKVFEGMK